MDHDLIEKADQEEEALRNKKPDFNPDVWCDECLLPEIDCICGKCAANKTTTYTNTLDYVNYSFVDLYKKEPDRAKERLDKINTWGSIWRKLNTPL